MKLTLIAFISCALIASVFSWDDSENEKKDYCPIQKFPEVCSELNYLTCFDEHLATSLEGLSTTCVPTCECTLTGPTGAVICSSTGGGTCACTGAPVGGPFTTCTAAGIPENTVSAAACSLSHFTISSPGTDTLYAGDFQVFVNDLSNLLELILNQLGSTNYATACGTPTNCTQEHREKYDGYEKYADGHYEYKAINSQAAV